MPNSVIPPPNAAAPDSLVDSPARIAEQIASIPLYAALRHPQPAAANR